jgi:hypothetical protein
MSDTADMHRIVELWADKGGCDILCDSWTVVEIVNDTGYPVAWVGPMVSRIEGSC